MDLPQTITRLHALEASASLRGADAALSNSPREGL